MVADGVHVLLGPAVVMVLLRTRRVEPYLVALLFAGVPDLDRYLFDVLSLPTNGYVWESVFVHRGITHSLLAMALFVGLAYLIGEWRAGAIGYGSHLTADLLTGGIQLFSPFALQRYGLELNWLLASAVTGASSSAVLVVGVMAMSHPERVDQFRAVVRRRVRASEWTWAWASRRWRRWRGAAGDGSAADPAEYDRD
jgi:inner membrane protein